MVQVFPSAREAIFDLKDGASIMAGGFGICGVVEGLIDAVCEKGVKDLTVISNGAGVDDWFLGKWIKNRQVRKMICSRIGSNKELERQYLAGTIEVEFVPQGTFAERIRAGGAGLGGFYTKTGVGTVVAEGKETKVLDGETYLLEIPLRADYAFVKAWRGDTAGNLIYRMTAQNFNHVMAMAGRTTIAEVEELVPAGELDPNHIHTPGIFVQRVFQGARFEKRIEILTLRKRES
ncbi:MAG: CoA transferase subunit A [Candidatus Tectomicrobia bacterium]|nr:CoA transferase subunit A [Candidatus Tectomicrobia bacterium]